MELNSEAINALETLILRTVAPKPLDTHTPALVIAGENGAKIQSIENLQAGRARFRGSYSTGTLGDFCAYAGARATSPVVFISAESGSADAFFNLGDELSPGHGDDRACLSLKPTSAYKAVLEVNGKQFKQRALAEWLEDWSDIIQPFYGDEVRPTLAQAIQAVRNIEIKAGSTTTHEDRDFGATRTAMEQIEARAKEAALQLPSGFIFNASPFEGFESVAFRLRLSVTPSDQPTLALRIVSLADAQERIAREFVALVRDGLAVNGRADARIYRGAFAP